MEETKLERVILINRKNGDTEIYREWEYGDYYYDGKCFIVKDREGAWIGIYNLDILDSVIIRDIDPEVLDDDDWGCDPEECDGCPEFHNCFGNKEDKSEAHARVVSFNAKTVKNDSNKDTEKK